MRIKRDKDEAGRITRYTMWLSRWDTYDWARKPGAAWPGSSLSGFALRVDVDSNGLCDLSPRSRVEKADGHELDAIIADHLPADCRHLWPVWIPECWNL